jgi:hypothetical protein
MSMLLLLHSSEARVCWVSRPVGRHYKQLSSVLVDFVLAQRAFLHACHQQDCLITGSAGMHALVVEAWWAGCPAPSSYCIQ